jgi:hypothetical protein
MVSIVSSGLAVMAGPGNPEASSEHPNAASVPMLALCVASNDWSDMSVTSVTVTASGTGNFNGEVSGVELWLDADGDGRAGTGDTQLGSTQTFLPAATSVTFNSLSHAVAASTVEHWLVLFSFNSATDTTTFAASLAANADISAVDVTWGNTVVVEGAPVNGGVKTIQSSGVGDLAVFLGACSPVNQSPLREPRTPA